MSQIEEVVHLRNRVEELECETQFLKEALRPTDRRFHSLGLTPSERIILHRLYLSSPDTAKKESLVVALDNENTLDPIKTVHVFIHKLRKKLRPVGVFVRNDHGIGYYIEASDKVRLDAIIAREASQ